MFYLMWQKKAYKRGGEDHGHLRTPPPPSLFGYTLREEEKVQGNEDEDEE